jgi:hypothetical protein
MTPASSRLSRLVIATAAAVIAAVPALAEPALLKLGDVKGEATDDKHKGEIEIESFSWGAAADQPPDVATSDPQEGGQVAVAGRKAGGTQTETLERATSRGERVKSVIPQQSITTPRDSASGLATGKRQHMPIRVRQGSVELTMPEGVCVAGAHYPAVTLRSGDQAYEMRDVTVASCTPVATAKGKKDKAKLDYMVVKMETVFITG